MRIMKKLVTYFVKGIVVLFIALLGFVLYAFSDSILSGKEAVLEGKQTIELFLNSESDKLKNCIRILDFSRKW